MLNLRQTVIEKTLDELERAYRITYGSGSPLVGETVTWCGRLALENIANSDALYHDLDHTIMVTLVGLSILQGRHLLEGRVTPIDWLNFTMALLCHDIGFVRGVCKEDRGRVVATGIDGQTVVLPPSATDAALAPYHVDRSKLFIRERFSQPLFMDIDVETVCSYIEMTRFPVPDDPAYQETASYGGLVRAADFIGQLGDPDYLRKLPALYYELAETGAHRTMGYTELADMRRDYARFYWTMVSPYIQDALGYLRVTQEGKQWIANLHSHVFEIEHLDQV